MITRRTRQQIAARVARDLPDGSYVNLGIGIPTLVAEYIPPDREVVLHSENGVLGVGPRPAPDAVDRDLINASKDPVTLLPGGSFFSHADSFAMIRGGHLDIAIMGAYEVSASGDLANWSTGDGGIPAVGGAMDLACGARQVIVLMLHQTSGGENKLVARCAYPLTAPGVVTRVYTDVAVLAIEDGEFAALELTNGLDLAGLQRRTGAPVRAARAEEFPPLGAGRS